MAAGVLGNTLVINVLSVTDFVGRGYEKSLSEKF